MVLFLRNGTEVFKKSWWHYLEMSSVTVTDVGFDAHPFPALQLQFFRAASTRGKLNAQRGDSPFGMTTVINDHSSICAPNPDVIHVSSFG